MFSLDKIRGNKLSVDETGNSTKTLLLASATYTGAWEKVTDYTLSPISIKGDNATDGTLKIDVSQDSGTNFKTISIPIADASIEALPYFHVIAESYIRIRYVNGTTAQTGHFQLQTKYSNAQDRPEDGGLVSGNDPFNSTTTPLGISGVFIGEWSEWAAFAQFKISFTSDEAGANCVVQFSEDQVSIDRTVQMPPVSNSLQTEFGGTHTLDPILKYYRVIYTNGLTAQGTFSLHSHLSIRSGTGLISRATQILNKQNDVTLNRTVSDPTTDRNLQTVNFISQKTVAGGNPLIDNGGGLEDLWATGGDRIFLQTADNIRIKSGGNAADDTAGAGARSIEVKFLDNNWDEVTETLTSAGTSASASSSATCIRLLKARVLEVGTYHGSNTGDMVIETDGGTNLGTLTSGLGITRIAGMSVPRGHTAYIQNINFGVGDGPKADIQLNAVKNANDVSAPFSGKFVERRFPEVKGMSSPILETWLKFGEYSDIWFSAEHISGGGDADVTVNFDYALFKND